MQIRRATVLLGVLLLVSACAQKESRALPDWLWEGYSHQTATVPEKRTAPEPDELSARPTKGVPGKRIAFGCAGVLFTHGSSSSPDPNARDLLIAAIASAPKGAKLYMAMFSFSDVLVKEALLEAAKSGVEIHLLVDPEVGGDLHTEAASRLRDISASSEWLFSKLSHKPHVKFVAISKTANCSNWIFASSYHPTGSAMEKYQQSVFLSDTKMFNALADFWRTIKADQRPTALSTLSADGLAKLVLFPRDEDDGDYVKHVFDNVAPAGARIDVAMARWTAARKPLVNALCARAISGAKVRILTRDADEDGATAAIVERLENCKSAMAMWSGVGTFDFKVLPTNPFNIHAKYFLIEGLYGGDGNAKTHQQIVWSGSHNFTGAALTSNYEIIIKNRDNATFTAFRNEFDSVWNSH